MGIMMLVVLVALFAAVFLGVSALRRDQLPPSSPEADRLLRQQAERIDELEEELRRLQEQADFTEKLLSDRDAKAPGELPPGDPQ